MGGLDKDILTALRETLIFLHIYQSGFLILVIWSYICIDHNVFLKINLCIKVWKSAFMHTQNIAYACFEK